MLWAYTQHAKQDGRTVSISIQLASSPPPPPPCIPVLFPPQDIQCTLHDLPHLLLSLLRPCGWNVWVRVVRREDSKAQTDRVLLFYAAKW